MIQKLIFNLTIFFQEDYRDIFEESHEESVEEQKERLKKLVEEQKERLKEGFSEDEERQDLIRKGMLLMAKELKKLSEGHGIPPQSMAKSIYDIEGNVLFHIKTEIIF